MHLMTYVLLAILAIVVAITVIGVITSRRQKAAYNRAVEPHRQWAEKVMVAENDEAIVSYTEPKLPGSIRRSSDFPAIVQDARIKWREADARITRQHWQAQALEAYERVASLTDISERVKAYEKLSYDWLDDETRQQAKREAEEIAQQYAATLLESARTGHRQCFLKLVAFAAPVRYYSGSSGPSRFTEMTGQGLLPDDWDVMVARFYKTPSRHDFRFKYVADAAGSLRLIAVEALDQRSLLLAKVVLAHYDERDMQGDKWREEIGEILMTDLGKLVVRLHQEQELSFTS